jgi:hypothetical protein
MIYVLLYKEMEMALTIKSIYSKTALMKLHPTNIKVFDIICLNRLHALHGHAFFAAILCTIFLRFSSFDGCKRVESYEYK